MTLNADSPPRPEPLAVRIAVCHALAFFVLALIASLLGFGGLARLSAQIGWIYAVSAVMFLSVALLSRRGQQSRISFRSGVRGPRVGRIGEPSVAHHGCDPRA
jgi:uncharacterized membrane protein YtjA (UPF0391 family)